MKRMIAVGTAVRVELLLGRDGELKGIGNVMVGKTALRDGARPWVLRIDTPDGILYTRYVLKRVKMLKGGADVELAAYGLPWGRQEYCDEYSQQLVSVTPDMNPVVDAVTVRFRAVTEQLAGREWTGFSYTVSFASAKRRVHRILSDASWELDGSIVGNTVLNQGQCNMPVYTGSKAALFTTACLKTLDKHGDPQGMSYQLGPRGGILQGFDFQHGESGALLQYWPEFEPISSLVESPRGSTRLHVIDEYRFELARKVTTTPQRVLFAKGDFARHEARDLWWHAYEHAYARIRASHGVTETVVRPEKDLEAWPRWVDGELVARLGEHEYKPADVLDGLAEVVLPQYAKAGVKRIMVFPVNESDVTQGGLVRKIDQGVHGDWLCGSVCCTHRYWPSDFWGGMPAFRRLADRAHALGMEIGVWTSAHLSPRAAILTEHPDWLIRAQHTLTMGGGYWNCTGIIDWNSGAAEWIANDLLKWHREGGLDYIFVDSWANLSFLCPNYADRMRNNLHPLGKFYARLQKAGLKSISFEGISPFGYSRFGMADLRTDKLDATQGIVGQNDFGWWHGNEDMAFNVALHLVPRKRTDEEMAQIRFRLMAARGGILGRDMWDDRMAKIYERALPAMRERHLLPGQAGIRWTGTCADVYWLFKPMTIDVPSGARAHVIEADGEKPCANSPTVRGTAWTVYRIGS